MPNLKLIKYNKKTKKKSQYFFSYIKKYRNFILLKLILLFFLLKNGESTNEVKNHDVVIQSRKVNNSICFEPQNYYGRENYNIIEQNLHIGEKNQNGGTKCTEKGISYYDKIINKFKVAYEELWYLDFPTEYDIDLTTYVNKKSIKYDTLKKNRILEESKYPQKIKVSELKDICNTEIDNFEVGQNGLSTVSDSISEGILFYCFIFISATMIQFFLSKINKLSIPVSVIWFLYGMCTYGIAKNFNMFEENALHKSIINARNIDASILYFILLPILLYEATQDINYYAFKNFIYGGIALAVVGVALQVAILGVLFYYTFMYKQEQSPLSSSFLLASILSSTDPVAVLSILLVVDAPTKISSMFHVESLINDGSSVLLFQFFFYLTIGYKANASQYIILFVKLLFLSPVFGIGMAILTFIWMNMFRKYYYNQCLATITMCYLCYFISEYCFNLSGPLSIVCYGLFINAYGHIALDEIAQRKHKEIVEVLALMGNSSIFIISGIITVGMMENVFRDNLQFLVYIILTYLFLLVARAIMILLFTPFLSRIGYPINWKEILLLIWGGLRGGIVLVLGLRIEAENKINDKLTTELAYYISGSVLLILTIQGLTFECLYKMLNIYPPNPFRIVYLEKVLKMIDYNFSIRKKNLKNYWLFNDTNILYFSNKIVPELYWRKMNKYGEFDLGLPDIYACLQDISACDISAWERYTDSQTAIDNLSEQFSKDNMNIPSKSPNKTSPSTINHGTEVNINNKAQTSRNLKEKEMRGNDNINNDSNILRDDTNILENSSDEKTQKKNNKKKNEFNELKNTKNNYLYIEDDDNSDEYSYTNKGEINRIKSYYGNDINSKGYHNVIGYNDWINNGRNDNKKGRRSSSMKNKVGDFMTRRRKNYSNIYKNEMRINVIRNNYNSNDEDDNNFNMQNNSISRNNIYPNSNENSEIDSVITDNVEAYKKIKNLNVFNYDKISIKTYDRLINKMNYREFKRIRDNRDHFTVIDNIVDNKDNKEDNFDPKYNLRLIEHATDLPKTLSDNYLVKKNTYNINKQDSDSKNPENNDKQKKKNNFLIINNDNNKRGSDSKSEHTNENESNCLEERKNSQADYSKGNINNDDINKKKENILADIKDLGILPNINSDNTINLRNLHKGENELIMNDDFVIKIQKDPLKGEGKIDFKEINSRKKKNLEKDQIEKYNVDDESDNYNDTNNIILNDCDDKCDDNITNKSKVENKNNENQNDEYLTYQNLFTLDTNGKRISSFFNNNYRKDSYIMNHKKKPFGIKISTKNTNEKRISIFNSDVDNKGDKYGNKKGRCSTNSGIFNLLMCKPRKKRNDYTGAKSDLNEKNIEENEPNMENCDYINNNEDNNIDDNFMIFRYDTDQTINFEYVKDKYHKNNSAFYRFLRRPKIKIQSKQFDQIRRSRSHENYRKNKDKYGKLKDGVFHSYRKQIIRKEREGELYIMIFNTCKELYKKLYVNGFISGECLLTLNSILDLSADFALKKVKMNPIRAWADAFNKNNNNKNKKKAKYLDHRNGFEYEFTVLLSKLKFNKKNSFFCSPKVLNIFLIYEYCMNDLQIILAYVDVHQCTLDKGGITMKLLLGKNLLKSYYRNIKLAKGLIPLLVNKYKDVVKYCLIKIGADMLMHLKKMIVNEQVANGLLLTQDNEKLNYIFDEQKVKINRYRPYLHYIFKRNLFKLFVK
ncbi:sodium/hydrogen exchanger protein [Plasmodium yoelii]|uniref:Sodium/hydrogen exchanger n=3 Tax=Plasmodium yoelii TaxID=5861 RepID=A0AAE9X2B8_PLAYO|nr:sodium/hydrogen exchanger protein [Plasmodium yoelii]EAA22449.1 Sodium/hydrogen exchanger family protein, putative [Plasmodium yoelii yoelii]WBY60578.1 sodium/hydrogen exchanger [Plasmodium yoelii yoelii]CDU20391.1 sodium/hydrogen exchanger, Na+, H+ antiporter, putative [Plasmodium yoelii]VTZ81351.1 sodium/hydrogen exchanger, putative [Plasmodium yoelii]|eukprot:XP_730884.1 sodium/hydrogen exchanger protein [Plasmodium yoelii]